MINNEDIQRAEAAALRPKMVESAAELEACAQQWADCDVLGVDTEFVRERTFRAELGLVQVSDGNKAWLIDPLTIEDLSALTGMLEHSSTVKVLHSASEDLEVLWFTLGVSPRPMFDTQIACALLGQPLQTSYHAAVKWLCDVEVDKEQTRSNWIKRPLRDEQLHYAACDVVFLPAIYRELDSRLKALHRREWADQEVELMRHQSCLAPDPESAYLRLKGAGRLGQKRLRILRALAQWREETAIARNRARGFVVTDAVLMQLACSPPEELSELFEVDGMHPRVVQRYGKTLLDLIKTTRLDDEPVPEITPLGKQQKDHLDRLKKMVRVKSRELEIDPALLASRRVLEQLIRANATNADIPKRLQGWRMDIIARKLLAHLNSK